MTKKFLTISAAFFTSVATGISLFAGIFPGADAVETVIAAEGDISMTEGDVIAGFAPEETACESSDPSVAWVDPEGKLNALKEGTASINVPGEGSYTVNVSDYTDGSEVVGKLKLLARYNDSMQFYDGHVYLLFTSYQDGVEISVPDLYGKYDKAIDRESAFEVLLAQQEELDRQLQAENEAKEQEKEAAKGKKKKSWLSAIFSVIIGAIISSFGRSLGNQVAKSVTGSSSQKKNSSAGDILKDATGKAISSATRSAASKIGRDILGNMLK